MPKIIRVAKAQKDQGDCRRCRKPILRGDPYIWFSNRIGRSSIRKNFCAKCPPRPSDLTTSDKLSQIYLAQESLSDSLNSLDTIEDMASALRDAATEAREVAEAYRDSVSNMPENLQNSDQASQMEEKAQACDDWAEALDSAADDIETAEADEPEDDTECTECGHPFSKHKEKALAVGSGVAGAVESTSVQESTPTEENTSPNDKKVCDDFLSEADEQVLEDARSRASDVADELSIG